VRIPNASPSPSRMRVEYERNYYESKRPCGPFGPVQPALEWSALTGLEGKVSAR